MAAMRLRVEPLVLQAALLIGCALSANADGLNLCKERSGPVLLKTERHSAGCEWQDSVMNQADIIWMDLIAKSAKAPSRLVIEGLTKDGQFVPERAHGENTGATPRLPLLPFETNVLPLLDGTVFGREKRVSFKNKRNGLQLTCKPGTAPAGLILKPTAHRIPQGLDQSIVMGGVARGQFRSAAVAAGADVPATAPFFPESKTTPVELWLPDPAGRGLPGHGTEQIVLLCPETAGTIDIRSIALRPGAKLATRPILASWVWQPEDWQKNPVEILAWATSMQLNRLYLQLDIAAGEVAHPELLGTFLTEAADAGIAVFAVEGDPQMVRGDGRTNALARTSAISRFQDAAMPNGRLAGIQYDIEPYISPAYAFDRQAIWKDWSYTLEELHRLWRSNIEVVVPFWLIDDVDGRDAIERIQSFVSSFTVMAYRTSDEAIVEASEPWLNFGVLHGVNIIIALESGPVPDEVHRTYVRSNTGTAEVVRFSEADAVLVSDKPISLDRGMIYAFSHEIKVSGDRISFKGKLPLLLATIDRLRTTFPSWRSFSGFALHGLR